jgi:hypothetical protein
MPAICDQCGAQVKEGDGYIFYSSASFGFPGMSQETGNMFLCKTCTDEIVSTDGYKKAVSYTGAISREDFLKDPTKFQAMIQKSNAVSIVDTCKRHGLMPEEAKSLAHDFAIFWWQDRHNAQIAASNFWKTGKKNTGNT